MFCNACGKELQPGQQCCGACGQPVGVAPIPRSINRVAHHIQVLGILWIAFSLLNMLGSIMVMLFATAIVSSLSHLEGVSGQIPAFFLPVFFVVGIYLFFKSALGLAAGIGLLQRHSWARILAIVLGVIALLNIPFGTALGVYTLWTLLSPESQKEYEDMAKK
ncbi:MAG TPA: hypothetical protein VK699_16665 [Terriglobales bacterium]|jgi:hypothetical protein|nr:hypothetical protein [Terriglobales bacterium]